jgi:hypothetical protein
LSSNDGLNTGNDGLNTGNDGLNTGNDGLNTGNELGSSNFMGEVDLKVSTFKGLVCRELVLDRVLPLEVPELVFLYGSRLQIIGGGAVFLTAEVEVEVEVAVGMGAGMGMGVGAEVSVVFISSTAALVFMGFGAVDVGECEDKNDIDIGSNDERDERDEWMNGMNG